MINFTYHSPTKIIFGQNRLATLETELAPYQGARVLFVYGRASLKASGMYAAIMSHLKNLDIDVVEEAGVSENPRLKSVLSGRRKALDHAVSYILAAGGGSVVDCAKAIAFAATLDEDDIWPVFRRQKDADSALPLGVVLTLSGTGSEANGNTVITNDARDEKRSVAYDFLYPRFSLIDPAHTQSVNRHHSIAGAIDIIMHVFEQYFSVTKRTETSDYLCAGLIKSVVENTRRLLDGDNTYETRANLSWAATIGLNWLLQQGKVGEWATHRLSYPITQRHGVTHGYALSMIHSVWMETALEKNPECMREKLAFLGQEIFAHRDPARVIADFKAMFQSFGAPTSFAEASIFPDEETLEAMAENAVALGAVGTVIEIDGALAKDIYRRALR